MSLGVCWSSCSSNMFETSVSGRYLSEYAVLRLCTRMEALGEFWYCIHCWRKRD